MKTILDFAKRKSAGEKISMISLYDAWSAKLLAQSEVDTILVGDSVAMVAHGFDSTIHATLEMMCAHVAAVVRGNSGQKFIVGDMPFMSFRSGLETCMKAAQALMQAGAQAVKLEGADGHLDLVQHLVHSGVPVMGHLGLTPQFVNQLGGFSVQAKEEKAAEKLLADALALQKSGCFSLVLECVPSPLAKRVTGSLSIPTIGIGAGPDCDGQVLVFQDMMGMLSAFKPKFLKQYLAGSDLMLAALNQFHEEVCSVSYPALEHSYL